MRDFGEFCAGCAICTAFYLLAAALYQVVRYFNLTWLY